MEGPIKMCSKCKTAKPITEFHKRSSARCGVVSVCKLCRKKPPKYPEGHKKCNKCGMIKSYNEFDTRNDTPSGIKAHCKFCRKVEAAKRYENKREHILSVNKQWKKNNPERYIEINKRSNKKRPDKIRKYASKRRASKKQATPEWISENELFEFMLDEIFNLSKLREDALGVKYHVDHIVPLNGRNKDNNHTVCGLHVPWNLQVITAKENLIKNCYTWPDMW